MEYKNFGNRELPGEKSLQYLQQENGSYINNHFPENELVLPLCFTGASGSVVTDADGNHFIDLAFGLNVSCGHAHPRVREAAGDAFAGIANTGNYPNLLRIKLCQKLLTMLDNHFGGCILFSSGTEAVECGTWFLKEASGKSDLIAFHGSYHGKTLGAVSLAAMNPWQGIRAPGIVRIPYANCFRCAYKLARESCGFYCVRIICQFIAQNANGRVAGLVLEPVQGEAVIIPPPGYLQAIRQFCDDNGILMMVDEILTGLGRIGVALAVFKEGVIPDVVTVGKCLGSGIPISCTLVRTSLKSKVEHILGSSTYGGNPLSAGIGLQTLQIIEDEKLYENARKVEAIFREQFRELDAHPYVGDIRGSGALFGIEFVKDKQSRIPYPEFCRAAAGEALRRGVLTYPIGNTLRLSPALNIPGELARKAAEWITQAVSALNGMGL